MPIPDQLPPELVPPSARDLDTSVRFLQDILKNDNSRPASAGSASDSAISRRPLRSFNDTSSGGGRKDGTVYRHADDAESPENYYQSRSRHIDRRNVRTGTESPADDLSSMRRALEDTASRLDRAAQEASQRTEEDDELEREMSDLRYRVRRVQEDLDHVNRGQRSNAKDEERRKLERELVERDERPALPCAARTRRLG